jgi:hypothetical protein
MKNNTNNMQYDYNVDVRAIKRAIKNHDCYDSWGEVMYGNDEQVVDYNICIDNSTEETEWCSAFYRMCVDDDGYFCHDDCCTYYEYNIDFNDKNWKKKLKEAAIQAYHELWEEEDEETED